MDVFRRRKFDEAMFARNRTLAIRVGQYQSSDIKEASFDYGYIKGDAYKPGGTCAGSGKIIFSSIITTFNKLDKIYPEIGLLVDGTYEWVKMGEYFINDIEIDRNRKTTKLDLMDGMFKFNREHITSLTYPAEIRQVIKEICLKTGVELANENMDLTSMNYQIEKIPSEKKMTFRDVLSLASQMLGMSCFFNREGKLEIKELTDSGITITADSYFMHGLTKSEIEYRIAGITCKKDKETLTVGLRTGRSLELENRFMYQAILDNLYQKIKDIRYYPYSLNYQGHLLLNVGEWVTIKTNTGESFKSPVLSQSFTFKGGLRGRISADSKAGNDAQYSYAGTLTKKIEQFNEFEKQLQNQFEEADRGHDQKVEKLKSDFDEQIKLAKAKAEEVKQSLTETIDQRFRNFDSAGLREAKQKSDEALTKAGASALLAEEAKRISEQAKDGIEKAKESFLDSFKANSAELDILNDRLKKFRLDHAEFRRSTKEDIKGLTESFTKLGSDTKSDILATRTEFQKTAEGLTQRFESVTSQLDNKANLLDFQRVQETSKLYERIIGSSESDIAEKVARMALTNQLFQVEVGKYANAGGPNMLRNSRADDGLKYWTE
ncbi:ATP synthase F0 subunit B, partial [Streptococcus oralis]